MANINRDRTQSVALGVSALGVSTGTSTHLRTHSKLHSKLAGSTLTLMLLLFPLALPSLSAYRRPNNARPPSTATSTSGARNGTLQLTLLAPQQHVGQSQSTHPTFKWFSPAESGLQGEFQLYEITGTGDISETDGVQGEFQRVLETPYEFVSEQGVMSFTLPADMAGLKPNTQYIWQVLLRYGPRASDIFMVRSQIEILASSLRMPQTTPANTPATTAQVTQLSEAGLWYDALALTSQLAPNAANAQRNELLLALAKLEASTIEIDSEPTDAELTDSEPTDSSPMTTGVDIGIIANGDEMSHSEALRQIVEWQNSESSALENKPTANLPPT